MQIISPSEIPDGSDYQWAGRAVCGDESLGDLIRLKKTGWREVPRSRHPRLITIDPKWIDFYGLVLVERPSLLTARAKVWEQHKADDQIVGNFRALNMDDAQIQKQIRRPVNLMPLGRRKTTIREFFTKHRWTLSVWWRNLFIKGIEE